METINNCTSTTSVNTKIDSTTSQINQHHVTHDCFIDYCIKCHPSESYCPICNIFIPSIKIIFHLKQCITTFESSFSNTSTTTTTQPTPSILYHPYSRPLNSSIINPITETSYFTKGGVNAEKSPQDFRQSMVDALTNVQPQAITAMKDQYQLVAPYFNSIGIKENASIPHPAYRPKSLYCFVRMLFPAYVKQFCSCPTKKPCDKKKFFRLEFRNGESVDFCNITALKETELQEYLNNLTQIQTNMEHKWIGECNRCLGKEKQIQVELSFPNVDISYKPDTWVFCSISCFFFAVKVMTQTSWLEKAHIITIKKEKRDRQSIASSSSKG